MEGEQFQPSPQHSKQWVPPKIQLKFSQKLIYLILSFQQSPTMYGDLRIYTHYETDFIVKGTLG